MGIAKVLSNERLSPSFSLLEVESDERARMGQFFMLRSWGDHPLLSRPISVHDARGGVLKFLYREVGAGTRLLGSLERGDEFEIGSARGRGYPDLCGRIALVGGGTGIAPLLFAAATLKEGADSVDCYLGFSDEPILIDRYEAECSSVSVDVGGYITDKLDASRYDAVIACGPEPMMRAAWTKCKQTGTRLIISLERKMACGFGVCLGCSVMTTSGRKRVCVDGPVFEASEIFADN